MPVHATRQDGVTVLTLDHGKVNALDHDLFAAIEEGLDAAGQDAVVIAGRPGMFSAGLDVRALAGDQATVQALLVRFARTMHRIWLEPRPIVAAATGHAIAGGTILAMCCDHAVAARGEFGWGLIETTIGFPMPAWILAIARGNVRVDRLDDLLLAGARVGPEEAVDVGFADALADPEHVLDAAAERARALGELPRATYAETKRRLRGQASAAGLDGLEDDIAAALGAR